MLTFNDDISTFSDYLLKLVFSLYIETGIFITSSECFPDIEWFLTTRDPLLRLQKFLKGMKVLKNLEPQKALAWRRHHDVVQLSKKPVPIIKISESEYKSILNISKIEAINLSREIEFYVFELGYTQLGLVISDPEDREKYELKKGILVDVYKDHFPLPFIGVQFKESMLFNLYDKHQVGLLAQLYKYKEDVITEEANLLLEECTILALDFIKTTDIRRYYVLQSKLDYFNAFEYKNKFKLKFFLLLSIISVSDVNSIFACILNIHKLQCLKYSIERLNK